MSKKTYAEIIKDVTFFKFQKKLQNDLKKIIPVSNVTVKKLRKLK